MKQFFLLSVLVFCYLFVFGQAEDPFLPADFGVPMPQRSENLSSGTLNISLPVDNSVLPVSIAYSAGGIPVNQRPGTIGQGWNLQVGGSIVRQKRGLSDGETEGYSGKYKRGNHFKTGTPHEAYFKYFSTGSWDPEPDVYQFQFPGQSGAFTMTPNREIVMLTASNVKIVPYFTDISGYYMFSIFDEQGNEYQFNASERMTMKNGTTVTENFRSKWFLTKIIYYGTGDEMNLSYITAANYEELTPFRWQRRHTSNGSFHSSSYESIYAQYTYPKLLDEITYKDVTVKFYYNSRDDLTNVKKLYYIAVLNEGVVRKKYYFNYRYTGTGTAKRLFLAGILRESSDDLLYQFNYYGEAPGEYILPAYNSYAQDHWGYYNANTASSLFTFNYGVNRNPSLPYARAGTIKKVIYGTGGFEEYEYQLNTYNDAGIDRTCGGLRINKVHKNDGLGNSYVTKTYSYLDNAGKSSGQLYKEPVYKTKYYYQTDSEVYDQYNEFSVDPLRDIFGRHIAYEFITITDADGGSQQLKMFTFTDENTHYGAGAGGGLGREALRYIKDNDLYEPVEVTLLSDPGPFGAVVYRGGKTGMPEEKIVKDAQGNTLLKETYGYKTHWPKTNVYGMNFLNTAYKAPKTFAHSRREWLYSYYYIADGYVLQSYITKVIYDPVDVNNNRTEITAITYDPDRPLVKQTSSYLSGAYAERQITNMVYLKETTLTSQEQAEADARNLGTLVASQTQSRESQVISKKENNYGITGGKLRLLEEKTFIRKESADNLTGHNTYQYNNNGRLMNIENQLTSQISSQIFDGQGKYVIAKTSEAANAHTAYTGFESGPEGNWNFPALLSNQDCSDALYSCEEACDESYYDPQDPCYYDDICLDACFDDCYNTYLNCQNDINVVSSIFGSQAYILSGGDITSNTLPIGTYILSYWMKNGTVSISGVSSNVLLTTRTLEGWIFEERKVSLSSAGIITISGTAEIDELRCHPIDSRMATTAYHPVYGPTLSTGPNHDPSFYYYDSKGYQFASRDRDYDFVQYNDYHIGRYLDISTNSVTDYEGYGATLDVMVTGNYSWTATESLDWVSLPDPMGWWQENLQIVCAENTTGLQRSGNVTVTMSGTSISKTINVVQEPPTPFIDVLPEYIDLDIDDYYYNDIISVDVFSNCQWQVSVSYFSGGFDWINLYTLSGQDNDQLLFDLYTSNLSYGYNDAEIRVYNTTLNVEAYVTVTVYKY